MRKPGTVLLLAIVIGALSAALIYRHFGALRAEIEASRSAPPAMVEVVVANETIRIGTRIEDRHVRPVTWPANLEPQGALHDPRMAIDRVVRATIEKNQPLSDLYLLAQGEGLLPITIAVGKRAMSVRVDEVTGVSGFITPNSRVDVLVAASQEGRGNGEQWSKVILQNLRVLATGRTTEQRDDKPAEVPTVTLLVSPEEAETLALATRLDSVRLALRGYEDEAIVGTPGMSTAALFDGHDRRAAPAPVVVRGERRPRDSVEVLLGEKLTRQEIP